MIDILKSVFKQKKIVSICVGQVDWDNRILGYIDSIGDDYVILNTVDIYGAILKKAKFALNRITVVELDDTYNKHLERLKRKGSSIRDAKSQYYYNRGRSFPDKIKPLLESRSVCTFFFDTEYVFGSLIDINEEFLRIKTLGYTGSDQGELFCRHAFITKIRYNGPMEKKIMFLRE